MDREKLKKIIQGSTQHNYLYHFTDELDFPSIKTHGLLSKQKMEEIGVNPDAPVRE